MFTEMLVYKAAEAGCQLVSVNPAASAERVEKDLDVRVHRCLECGLELDREVNAARNIHQKAFKTLGSSVQDST